MMTVAIQEVPTMNLVTEHKVWTEDDLMSLPDAGGKYELVEGELVVVATTLEHEDVVSNLMLLLGNFVRAHSLGRIYASSLGCWMKSGNLRSPDVSFVAKNRFKEQDPKRFFRGAPDLAIEILSPSNTVQAMKKKATEYFENGCRLMWIVSPEDRSVTVLRLDGTETIVTDTLTGEDVVPGFSLVVAELFEDLM